MTNYGIDYGMGTTNIDTETGIRFGVIPQHDCLQAWADSSEPVYACEECDDWDDELDECIDAVLGCEPIGYTYEEDGYKLTGCEDGDIFVEKSPYFTYAQFCSPCAPGACHLRNPLDVTEDEHKYAMLLVKTNVRPPKPNPLLNNRCYCLGHDWFYDTETGHAPYNVYSVETGELINP
jgi:hypothetical protein